MSTRRVEFNGRTYNTINELSRETGVPSSTIRRRLDNGASPVFPYEIDMGAARRRLGLTFRNSDGGQQSDAG